MITFTGILILMLAYAALSLGVICLLWHLGKNDLEQGWQERPARKAINRLPVPVGKASRNLRMVDGLSTFGRVTVLAAVVAAVVAFIVYQPAFGTASIGLSTGPSVSNSLSKQDDGRVVN